MNRKVIKTKFTNFPPDLNPHANVFLDALNEIDFESAAKKRIHFYGCYPKIKFREKAIAYARSKVSNKGMVDWLNTQQGIELPKNDEDFNIWVTFENRRPPHKYFDLTISFDLDNYNENNLYLPLIYQYMNISGTPNNYSKHEISPLQATKPRTATSEIIESKKRFCVSFINNPHPIRLRAQDMLSKIDDVATFGRSVNNYSNNKLEETKNYWFSLCFENDLYPGYVTEKALEAWLGWSIPLYWGDDAAGVLNPEAIINLANFRNLNEFVRYIEDLYGDKKRLVEMINQPLLIKNFELNELTSFIKNKLIQD